MLIDYLNIIYSLTILHVTAASTTIVICSLEQWIVKTYYFCGVCLIEIVAPARHDHSIFQSHTPESNMVAPEEGLHNFSIFSLSPNVTCDSSSLG